MKNLKLILVLITFLFVTGKSYSQMIPPEPIKSPLLESMMGTWVSDPYQMMGSNMTDEATHSMILNGQFMEIDVVSKADNGFTYLGKILISPNSDGSWSGTAYDIFGKNGITNYTGTSDGNKVTMSGRNDMMSEVREIIIDGNTMTHNVTFDIKGMPQEKVTITYKKKN